MSTTASKLSYLKNTVDQFENKSTDLFGEDFIKNATFRELANEYKNLWTDWPDKVTAEGTNIELNNVKKGKMVIQPKGNTIQDTSILPSEYQQVEYIESTGTQYIDTGVSSSQSSWDITIEYTQTSSSSQIAIGKGSERSRLVWSK